MQVRPSLKMVHFSALPAGSVQEPIMDKTKYDYLLREARDKGQFQHRHYCPKGLVIHRQGQSSKAGQFALKYSFQPGMFFLPGFSINGKEVDLSGLPTCHSGIKWLVNEERATRSAEPVRYSVGVKTQKPTGDFNKYPDLVNDLKGTVYVYVDGLDTFGDSAKVKHTHCFTMGPNRILKEASYYGGAGKEERSVTDSANIQLVKDGIDFALSFRARK